MKFRFAHALLPLTFAPLVLGACRTADKGPEAQDRLRAIDELSAKGRYEDALAQAEIYSQKHPGDAEAERQLRRAKAAVMLEKARVLCFKEKNLEALNLIREAQKIEPGEKTIDDWELKMRRKLADIHSNNGDEFFASSNLEAARDEYESALTYVAEAPSAKAGLAQVLLQINHRNGMGQQYYEDGVHLLRDYWLEQAKTRFQYVGKYQPKNDRAQSRGQDVSSQLAGNRCVLAQGLEQQGLWAAARNEYRIALLLDSESPEAVAGMERTRTEADAAEKLREVDRYTRGKQWDKAREAIEAGLALTKFQTDAFEGAKAGIEEAIVENDYRMAITLESDQDYEDAIKAYDRLLAQREYYKDALARRDTLMAYVEKATGLYQQAMDATDPLEKLKFLRQIALFWPEYKNVDELIELLKPAALPEGEGKPVQR